MSDLDLEDFEGDQTDVEKEDDDKDTEELTSSRIEGEELSEEEHWVPTPLSEDMMKEGLSMLCKTGSGLAHAFVRLEVKDRDLTDITLLQSYIHLRYVDISENHLVDLSPLNHLTHLLWLKADNNQLRSARLHELPYLQIVSFAFNQITDTEGISHPRLTSLDLKGFAGQVHQTLDCNGLYHFFQGTAHKCSIYWIYSALEGLGNRIQALTSLDSQKLQNLQTLELRGNQLTSTLGINFPKLKNLFLAQNQLMKVEGLENLSNLTTLHLRDNMIETLNGFSKEMKSLQYINLRGNMVSDLGELAKLRELPKLRALVLLENPCAEESEYRQEALVQMANLERLDKDFYEEEERLEADEIRQRLKEEPETEQDIEQEHETASN